MFAVVCLLFRMGFRVPLTMFFSVDLQSVDTNKKEAATDITEKIAKLSMSNDNVPKCWICNVRWGTPTGQLNKNIIKFLLFSIWLMTQFTTA